MGVLGEAAEQLNRSPKTLANYVAVARNPISHQAEELGLAVAHAQAVIGLPDDAAIALLTTAAEQGLGDDWLRHQARMQRGMIQLMNEIKRDLKPAGSAPLNDNQFEEKTYTGSTLTSIDDGGTQHRRHGVDPYPGVAVMDCELVDSGEVPFAEPVIEWPDNPTPFDIAEKIVLSFGQPFAAQVAEEVVRWSKWQ